MEYSGRSDASLVWEICTIHSERMIAINNSDTSKYKILSEKLMSLNNEILKRMEGNK